MTKRLQIVCAFFALILLISALGCNTTHPIVGRWSYIIDDAEFVWDFKADGALLLDYVKTQLDAKYEILDDDTLKVTLTAGQQSETIEIEYRIDGDTLTLVLDGSPQEFKRVK